MVYWSIILTNEVSQTDQIHKYWMTLVALQLVMGFEYIFRDYFAVHCNSHDYITRHMAHYDVSFYRIEIRNHCPHNCRAVIWKNILVTKMNITCSDYVFSRELKNGALIGQVWLFACIVTVIETNSVFIYAVITLGLVIFFYYFYVEYSTLTTRTGDVCHIIATIVSLCNSPWFYLM